MSRFVTTTLHRLGQLSRRGAARAFAAAVENPEAAQAGYLKRLLASNAGTEFGKQHGFANIQTPAEYAARVPLQMPLELQPWVHRSMAGQSNLLSAERPIYYATTSGSTAEPKYIPITPTYRHELQSTVHVTLAHLYQRFPEAFRGKALYFVGSRRLRQAEDGCDIGHMSGFNFTELPRLLRALYAWPYELFEVEDAGTRTTLALLLATAGRPSLIAGVYPASLVFLMRDLELQAGDLVQALRDGTLPADLKLSAKQRAFFAARLGGPNRENARRMERAAQVRTEQKVSAAWPELRLVYCWTSASAGLFVPELKRRLGPAVAVRDAIYSACEGWASIPLGDEEPGGVLGVNVHYFEFIEVSAYERGERSTLGAHQVEPGNRYYIILSTGSGLYRYVLGDIIEVYGRYAQTPRIRFVRKGGIQANLLGEKMDEAHVHAAMTAAQEHAQQEATFFTFVPVQDDGVLGYRLYLELPAGAGAATHEQMAASCDAGLQRANPEYAELRKSGAFQPLAWVRLPPGVYDQIRARRVAQGSADSQLKPAHLHASVDALPQEIL